MAEAVTASNRTANPTRYPLSYSSPPVNGTYDSARYSGSDPRTPVMKSRQQSSDPHLGPIPCHQVTQVFRVMCKVLNFTITHLANEDIGYIHF